MFDNKIQSVEKGFGQGSIFFGTGTNIALNCRVDEIKEEHKEIGPDTKISVYRGFRNGRLYFEMGASIDVTAVFDI